MSNLDYDDRVALVTGAGRGIGQACALALSRRGCRVVVNDYQEAACAAVVDIIRNEGGQAVQAVGSVVEDADHIVSRAVEAFGGLDSLINNAGIFREVDFAATPAEDWHRTSDVHYVGTVMMCRAAWRYLMRSSAGRIVNTSSCGVFGNACTTAYGSAKAAVLGFSRSLAIEGRAVGIGVNSIMPTAWTQMSENSLDGAMAECMKAFFGAEHVAAFVTWLAHPDMLITGETFNVGGGRASRIVFASTPKVAIEDVSAEGWAKMGASLMREDLPLRAMRSTAESLLEDMLAVDPAMIVDDNVQSTGLVHRVGHVDQMP